MAIQRREEYTGLEYHKVWMEELELQEGVNYVIEIVLSAQHPSLVLLETFPAFFGELFICLFHSSEVDSR